MFKRKHFFAAVVLAFALLVSTVPLVSAADDTNKTTKDSSKTSDTSESDKKAPVTQSYGTDETLQNGMIVQLDPEDSSKVIALTQEKSKNILGVVVAANESPISITSNIKTKQVYVATDGRYNVLVSTQNGTIATGDLVSISTIEGIGMKANDQVETVVGRALNSFDGKTNVLGTSTLTDSEGSKTEVSLGKVKVQVLVQSNPLLAVSLPTAFTKFLGRIGYAVSNKDVNPARLYLALVMMLIASFISAVLMIGGIKSAMTAIGRNPLAKKAIFRSLIQVIISSLIVFILGIFAVYLLLKL